MDPNAPEATATDGPYRPTLRDMVMLELPVGVSVAPGGGRAAICVRTTNWKEDCYERVCYVHDLAAGTTDPVTRTGDVTQMEWLDARTLALLRQGPGKDDKPQVWLYEGPAGEGWPVTDHKTGVEWFYPFAGGLLFLARQPKREENKARADRFGKFTHWEHEESAAALYYVGLAELRQYQSQVKASSEDEAKKLVPPVVELSCLLPAPLAIQKVVPSPAGDAIYLNCWPRDDLVYFRQTSAYCLRLDAPAALAESMRREIGKEKEIEIEIEKEKEDVSYLGQAARLNLPRAAVVTAVSPDGRQLLLSYQERDDKLYTRFDLWVMDAASAAQAPDAAAFLAGMRNISASLDREVLHSYWTAAGIVGSYVEGTGIRLARFGEDGQVVPLDTGGLFILEDCFSASPEGYVGLVGTNARSFPEAYAGDLRGGTASVDLRRLTDLGRAVEGWELGTVETIRWPSRDGTEIEGVLRKPAGFDPARRYPLVFIVHGGPAWFSPTYLLCNELGYYPAEQFLHKDVLVLEPNYRGSMGRGQAFSDLNVNNLGIGDLWDLESAIEHLDRLGWVDPERVGCMGWSQGGYISAFVGLQSTRFRAVSVGAGTANWYTYHICNDIPDFTVDYLSGSPFRNREPYTRTAPIANLAKARTPVLIQHGADDRRVPLSSALELYRGLQEMGVPVELYVYPGMAHPITKPRENHAVMHQNLAWFSHYLLGEDLELE